MLVHRLREQLRASQPAPVLAGGVGCGFVPCPVFAMFSAGQRAQVREIYRLAAEQTREQLRPRRSRTPQFSRN